MEEAAAVVVAEAGTDQEEEAVEVFAAVDDVAVVAVAVLVEQGLAEE